MRTNLFAWAILVAGIEFAFPAASAAQRPLPAPATRQAALQFASPSLRVTVGYYLYYPAAYAQDSTARFPLLLFLHGIGERGNGVSELSRVLKFGPPRMIERGRDFPFLVLTPQLPSSADHWPVSLIDEVLDQARQTLRVDTTRIYLTGLSDGGDASWNYAMARPDIPAAIVPIASEASPASICAMRPVAVWAFHGELDRDTKLSLESRLVDGLNACDPPPPEPARLTIYRGAGHLVWTRAYEGEGGIDIYGWLLQHHR
jgi:predicted peptidase